jgi:amidophosphoribosyltransferase
LISALREKCGVFGVFAPGEDVARITFFGLHALQHRGQESAGIATTDGERLHLVADMGLVAQIFTERRLSGLPGYAAIGHTRYSTTGSSIKVNAQPLVVDAPEGPLAIAHNGNVVNAELLREDFEARGVHFQTTTDTEVIAQILTQDAVYAVRDPMGVRPLCIGRMNGHGWVFASETCALDHLGADFVRDVEPGEVVRVDGSGLTSWFPIGRQTREATCLFESIYFSRPDSYLGGERVYPTRMRMGARLAREHPVEADLVIGVPDSATAAAIGYAQESGIPYGEGLVKNRYVGRTFIQPDQRLREQGVQLKFNPLREVLEGKRVIVVDDSIVRGTTTPRIIALLRQAGAREVHVRITSPPIQHPCFYGVDMATKAELIAAHQSVEEIRAHIGADSLGYLSLEGAVEATRLGAGRHCTACFSGEYPSPVPLELDKFVLEARSRDPLLEPEPQLVPLTV